jgi:hypothetical protein
MRHTTSEIKNNRNRNVKYKSLQNSVFKLAYHTSEKHWGSNINNPANFKPCMKDIDPGIAPGFIFENGLFVDT